VAERRSEFRWPVPKIDLSIDLLGLNGALGLFVNHDARKAELLKLRFFAGLTIREAAALLGIAESTADADWGDIRLFPQKKSRLLIF
jgi:hypothetical protein